MDATHKKRLKFFFGEFGNGQVMGTMDWMMRGIMVDVWGIKKNHKYIQGKFEPVFGPKKEEEGKFRFRYVDVNFF
jgi:hypothetical protein